MKGWVQRDLFPGALKMMILQVLKSQPLHSDALAQHIKSLSDDRWRWRKALSGAATHAQERLG